VIHSGFFVLQDGLAAHLTEYPSMNCGVTIVEHETQFDLVGVCKTPQ
jgi:hypothetical protein